MKNVRVALFVPSLGGGGAERVMVTLAGGFANAGVEVDLVLVNAAGPYLNDVPINVRIIDLKCKRVLKSIFPLSRYLRQQRPMAILSTIDHANVAAFWAKRLSGTNVRTIVRAASTLSESFRSKSGLIANFRSNAILNVYRRADAVIAVSQGVANDLVALTKRNKHDVHVIYNPTVNARLFEKSREPLNHPWFSENSPPVILGVGRLSDEKDFQTLINAFAYVRRRFNARLLILGEGEKRKELESLVRELGLTGSVKLPGFVENPFKYMLRSRMFVLSSRWEGLPNALIQALVLGTQVVSTDCPSGPREILEHGRWGKLVPVGDHNALADAILTSLVEKNQRPPNPDALVDRFGVDTICQKYMNILLEGTAINRGDKV